MSIKIRFVLLCCIRIIEWSVRGHVLVNFPSTHETLQHMENRLNTIVSHVAIDILTTRQLPACFAGNDYISVGLWIVCPRPSEIQQFVKRRSSEDICSTPEHCIFILIEYLLRLVLMYASSHSHSFIVLALVDIRL